MAPSSRPTVHISRLSERARARGSADQHLGGADANPRNELAVGGDSARRRRPPPAGAALRPGAGRRRVFAAEPRISLSLSLACSLALSLVRTATRPQKAAAHAAARRTPPHAARPTRGARARSAFFTFCEESERFGPRGNRRTLCILVSPGPGPPGPPIRARTAGGALLREPVHALRAAQHHRRHPRVPRLPSRPRALLRPGPPPEPARLPPPPTPLPRPPESACPP